MSKAFRYILVLLIVWPTLSWGSSSTCSSIFDKSAELIQPRKSNKGKDVSTNKIGEVNSSELLVEIFSDRLRQLNPTEIRVALSQLLTDTIFEIVKMNESEGNDVTGLRQETKNTVPKEVVSQIIEKLKSIFGEKFQLRDKTEEGKRNVTFTSYLRPIRFIKNGKKLSAKIRFRKYYSSPKGANLADFVTGNLPEGASDVLNGKQFVELKVQHEQFDKTVYKPRFIMSDSDVALMKSSADFIKNRKQILENTLKINKQENHAMIIKFFMVFKILAYLNLFEFEMDLTTAYEREAWIKILAYLNLFEFEMDLTTAYEREAWSLKLQDSEGRPVDVQFTFDHEIVQKMGPDDLLEGSYDDGLAVAEVKVPVRYGKFDQKDLENVPGLSEVVSVIQTLRFNHDPRYQMDHGKRSHAVYIYNLRFNGNLRDDDEDLENTPNRGSQFPAEDLDLTQSERNAPAR